MDIKKVTSLHDRIFSPLIEQAIDLLMPPHSLLSGLQIDKAVSDHIDNLHSNAEMELWQKIKFLDAPCCDVCGFPFEFNQGEEALCAPCIAYPPRYDKGRSAVAYDEFSRKLVLDFKHGGRTDGLDFFALQMARAGRELLEQTDIIVPVPLHAARLRKRKFNQSALLAGKLSKNSGVPYHCDVLRRRKNTPSQGTQTFAQRRKNVAGAFHIIPRYANLIKNAHVLLIDDVLTSGATLNACASVLKRHGAAKVYVLTLMRVVRATNIPK